MKAKIRTGKSVLFLGIVLALLLSFTGVVFAEEQTLNIPLNNDTAGAGTDCPATGGPYWHFVISPNNGNSYFITFHLNLGDATTYDTSVFVPNGDQLDNIFLAVPSGKTLTSLIKTGSSADIKWNGEDKNPPDKFLLSHTCSAKALDLTVSKDATPSFTRTFDWTIDKSADTSTVYSAGGGESDPVNFTVGVTKDAGTDSNWAVSGTITVYNPNAFAVSGVNLVDGACPVTPSVVDVPAGGYAYATYKCEFSSNPGSGTNTVTATWPSIGSPNTSASGSAGYTFGAPTTLVNDSITVTDTNGGSWFFNDSGYTTYSMTYTDPAGTCTTHENTATIVELGKTASASVTDCQGADLTVSKTAVPSFDLTYAWDITKSANPTWAEVVPGKSATFNYTVTVMHDAGTASNWAISGSIFVENPNDWQDVEFSLTDSLCPSVDDVYTVEAGKTLEIPYSCAVLATDSTNTATATWTKATYHTPGDTASGSADFAFGDPTNVIDECIEVIDTFGGTFGSVCVGDANPYIFTYTKSFASTTVGQCEDYTNTATFTTNDTGSSGSAIATVTVCTYNARLTPGYWKNHLKYDPKTLNPYVEAYLPIWLNGYKVDTTAKVTAIFNGMNCGSSKDQDAIGCLAGHLLAAKLNVANGANPYIQPTINAADALLTEVGYIGPTGKYILTPQQRALAISLKNALDKYNNGM